MNKTFLIGRLTKDPELRYSSADNAICNFTIAIDRNYTDSDGNKLTDFIRVIAYGVNGENTHKYCKKGSLVAVDGRIQTGSYEDKEGKKVYTTDVVANRVQFLSTKQKEEVEEKPTETEKLPDDVFAEFGEQIELEK